MQHSLLRRSKLLSADPHAGWCRKSGGEPRFYPIGRLVRHYGSTLTSSVPSGIFSEKAIIANF